VATLRPNSAAVTSIVSVFWNVAEAWRRLRSPTL